MHRGPSSHFYEDASKSSTKERGETWQDSAQHPCNTIATPESQRDLHGPPEKESVKFDGCKSCGNSEGTFARRARHPNQCSGHLSQCSTAVVAPKQHSLLKPRNPKHKHIV